MGPRRKLIAALAAVCALVCALPGHALASHTQRSILMDDDELIYSSPDHVARRLAEIASLGVDQVKVSMVWALVAPDATSARRPRFDATDPRAYPPGAWDRYDTLVRLARALGMSVYFQLTPPSPAWAIPRGEPRQGPPLGRAPRPRLFRQFVEAVGRRYDGTFQASIPKSEPPPSFLGLPVNLSSSQPQATQPGSPIPRVDTWGIWNEPNERSWLNPWYHRLGRGRQELLQPSLDRGLIDAAWSGLQGSGHAGDTVLIGETANKGILEPIPFVRALYCVGNSLEPLRGRAAAMLGCPTSGNAARFVAAHPGLFDAAGYAHHPYTFDEAPSAPAPDANVIALSNLPRFERTIDWILDDYGARRSGGMPLYLTEWGYKTDPPNPYVRTSLTQQARWLNQGEYMAWADPHVNALAQFELVDSPPKPGEPRGSALYWSTFQTGLLMRNGHVKPSFATFRLPIWVPHPRHGSRVALWGQLRPGDHAASQACVLQFRARGQRWSTLRQLATASPEGFVFAHVAIPAAGSVRIAFPDPHTGHVVYSRSVAIR